MKFICHDSGIGGKTETDSKRLLIKGHLHVVKIGLVDGLARVGAVHGSVLLVPVRDALAE